MRQTQKDKHCMILLICKIFIKLNSEKQSRMMVARAWELEKWGDVGHRVQTSTYKTNKRRKKLPRELDLRQGIQYNQNVIRRQKETNLVAANHLC